MSIWRQVELMALWFALMLICDSHGMRFLMYVAFIMAFLRMLQCGFAIDRWANTKEAKLELPE
jgi:hypothetical protein